MEHSEPYADWVDILLGEAESAALRELRAKGQRLMAYYRCAILQVETKFRVLDEQFSLQHERDPIDSIRSRLKSPESIRGKLMRRGLPVTLESVERELSDVAGVRVICPFVDDIYMLADCLLAQDDIRLLERKDYIKDPKPNGYRSLHLIVETPIFLQNEKRWVKAEVQLRTITMESWANLEHRLRYKKELDPSVAEQISDELNECARISAILDEKMLRLRGITEA